jgi:cyclopropane fatty-acyl-phospholipid synthase-like methyltransferase
MQHRWIAYRRWRGESPSTRDPQLIWYLLRRRGIRGLLGQKHLGDQFFELNVGQEQAYAEVADLLTEWAQPESVCDLGCGNGYILSALAQKGIEVQGVDGSPSVLRFVDEGIRDRVVIRDLSQPQDLGRYDLVISTGVAEHLPKRSAGAFVENVARHAKRHVFFAAAEPGQWGDGHINCQPQEYWIRLFKEQGLEHDPGTTERLSEACASSEAIREALPWLLRIIMVFERPG